MQFTDEDIQYLSGKKFNDMYHLLLRDNPLISRLDSIINITKGKKVLHIGCCDHIPLIKDRIKNKQWLHGLLLENCSFVAGIDINEDAVRYVINNFPDYMQNIYCADITDAIPSQLKETVFDFAVLGEIVEHINDPVSFLMKLRKNLGNNVNKIIITVPNALSFRLNKDKSFYGECINSDHRYWFTPYTIAKICNEAGIYPEELFFADPIRGIARRIIRKIARWLNVKISSKRNSIYSITLILIGFFEKKD